MPRSRQPYPAEFRVQMVALVQFVVVTTTVRSSVGNTITLFPPLPAM